MAQQLVAPYPNLPRIPAGAFGIVIGLAGLSTNWRMATILWELPQSVAEILNGLAVAVWIVVTALFAAKWLLFGSEAQTEATHPIQGCSIGLVGVATMLVAREVLSYSRSLALLLLAAGAIFSLVFAIWRTGGLWRGGRDPSTTTAVLYLPTVAGSLVCALMLSTFGFPNWALLPFGAGLLTWLALESVLLHRLLTGPELLAELRPTMGIVIAPPAVACAAYLGFKTDTQDVVANALLGYCLMQVLLYLRMLRWILAQPFALSYWTVTLGATALATASMLMLEKSGTTGGGAFAPYLFLFANAVVGVVGAGTARELSRHFFRAQGA